MEVNQLKSELSRFGIRPSKKLGQNFLLSEKVLDDIVAAAELTASDTVLEIGPGLGALTARLAVKAGEVIAVEKDRKLARALQKMFKGKGNVKIVEGDALKLTTYNLPFTTGFKLVANIPYYITGKLLQKFLTTPSQSPPISFASLGAGGEKEQTNFSPSRREGGDEEGVRSRPSLMVLLLQKEVAERICAKPGDMSILSVSVQFYAAPEIISYVGKENFYPVPEVDSAIVRITPLSSPLNLRGERGGLRFPVDEKKFFRLVKIGFSSKRKQLHNNLIAGLPSPMHVEGSRERLETGNPDLSSHSSPSPGEEGRSRDFKNILSSLGLNPLCRAEDLSLPDWKKLYEMLFPS